LKNDSIISVTIQTAKRRNRGFRLRKPPKQKSIKPLERQYYRGMTPMLKAMNETLRQDIIPYVSDILKMNLSIVIKGVCYFFDKYTPTFYIINTQC